jgi:hypothetical protein
MYNMGNALRMYRVKGENFHVSLNILAQIAYWLVRNLELFVDVDTC